MKKFSVLVPLLIIFFASFLLGKATPQIAAQSDSISQNPEQCLAEALTEYMNETIEGAEGLGNIRLLSPAFNLTSAVEPVVFSYMKQMGARFKDLYGFSGNTYTLDGRSAMSYYSNNGWAAAFAGKPVIFTEFGDFGLTNAPEGSAGRAAIISSMRADFNEAVGAGIAGISYFNALNTIPFNPDPLFVARHRLSEDELSSIISGNRNRAGLNQGIEVSGGAIEAKASELGMGWAVELITGPGQLDRVVASVNARPNVSVVVRLCYGSSCGFSDVEILKKFLADLNSQVNHPVYVIAGPNEPASEPWASPECEAISGVTPKGDIPGLPPSSGEPPDAPKPPIPYTACNQTRNPEFHSLRPYPASPCNYPPTAYTETKMCAEDLTVREIFQVLPGDATEGCKPISETTQECGYKLESTIDYSVFGGLTKLPIMGNTELVPNSQSNEDKLSSATRMSEYASWYLNGVTSRAEEKGELALDNSALNEVINFSGPLKKLLPLNVQNGLYNPKPPAPVSILDLVMSGVRTDQNSQAEAKEKRHNQIVACAKTTTLFDTSLPFPVPCYKEDGKRFRITDVEPLLSVGGFGFLTAAYSLNPLYSYIPFSSTEDVAGLLGVRFLGLGGSMNFEGSPVVNLPDDSKLFFPHMVEVNELANILQKTFTPGKYVSYAGGYSTNEGETPNSAGIVMYGNPPLDQYQEQLETESCSIKTVRKNPGDLLYGGWDVENGVHVNKNANAGGKKGDLTYKASFTCEFPLPVPDPACINTCLSNIDCYDSCEPGTTPDECALQRCQPPEILPCTQYAEMKFKVNTSTPLATSMWDRLVAGNYSVFKRIFPQVSPNAPVEKILDIPAEDKLWYTASNTSSNLPHAGTAAIAGNPQDLRPGSDAKAYFPHIGSVHQYFLQGIQCALRPKGMCGNSGFSSDTTISVPPTEDTTAICSVQNSGVQSQELLNIIASAARWANIPVEMLVTVVRGEGCGGGERTGGICQYSDAQVLEFSAAGAIDPRNCPQTGSKGPLQMYEDSVNWDPWENAVNLATGENRDPQICNLKDAIYAGAYRLSAGYDGCPNPGHSISSAPLSSWTTDRVYDSLTSWAMGCGADQCSGVAGNFYCTQYDAWSSQIVTDCN